MVKGKGHEKTSAAKDKASAVETSGKHQGGAAWYVESSKASLEKRLRLFQEKYGLFKEDGPVAVDGKEWLHLSKFAFLIGLEVLALPKCPSRLDLYVRLAPDHLDI
jgi:hypothetical protein